jgi:hypothetical protein
MKVEVELEDLETIIFATAIIKQIESSLAARKQDPFIRPHLDYNQAHDALTLAMNSARRANTNTATQWDGELNDNEIQLLKILVVNPVKEISAGYRKQYEEVDTLAAKGCIRIGQQVIGAVWPGADKADIKPYGGFSLMITQRGKDKIEKILKDEAK